MSQHFPHMETMTWGFHWGSLVEIFMENPLGKAGMTGGTPMTTGKPPRLFHRHWAPLGATGCGCPSPIRQTFGVMPSPCWSSTRAVSWFRMVGKTPRFHQQEWWTIQIMCVFTMKNGDLTWFNHYKWLRNGIWSWYMDEKWGFHHHKMEGSDPRWILLVSCWSYPAHDLLWLIRAISYHILPLRHIDDMDSDITPGNWRFTTRDMRISMDMYIWLYIYYIYIYMYNW